MRFYTRQHPFYCGINLHARTMYLRILNQAGDIVLHKNMKCDPKLFLAAIAPSSPDLVVGVECIFTWYSMSDLLGGIFSRPTPPCVQEAGDHIRKNSFF
jgi:hypothetical protein